MNLPNRLTLLRILLIPVCCALIALHEHVWAAGVFAVGVLTDFLDGQIARKRNLITVFGKFADPVADKLLVLTAMIMLTEQGLLPAWAVCVVAARELAVDGLRLVASGKGQVVAANDAPVPLRAERPAAGAAGRPPGPDHRHGGHDRRVRSPVFYVAQRCVS